ncbi:cation-transporting P-type ATPase [Candidatus Nitrospira bockiana]
MKGLEAHASSNPPVNQQTFPPPSRLHHLPAHEVLLLLETDRERGLTSEEAAARLQRFGANVLPRLKRRGPLLRFLLQFHHPLIYVLVAATAITAMLGEWVDAGVIAAVVVINALVGFIQESKAERALEALAAMMTTEVTVRRDGRKRRIPSSDVVPGDLVLLQSGDKVPADLRLVSVRELRVDESALTGESVPVEKEDRVLPPDTIVADRRNMAFSGTFVTYGVGAGVTVGTGASTELGRIHQLVGEAAEIATPLTKKLAYFSKILTVAILGLAAVTFAIGMWQGRPVTEIFMAAVALAVGAIPEGLPAAVTITLAIGVSRMAQRHAIIRKLPAVETLGSTTVICTDKTGTLTKNQMTVRAVLAGGRRFEVQGSGYEPVGEIHLNGAAVDVDQVPPLKECLLAGTLCNDAQIVEKDGRWDVVGDPTEGALLVAARKAGIDHGELLNVCPRVDAIPFESERQYMATLHGGAADGRAVIYVKGAVEKVVALCARELALDGTERPIGAAAILDQASALAGEGLRVLAFARNGATSSLRLVEEEMRAGGLAFLGLQAMMDPPRPEAIAAVHACQTAGIAVKMITGDHAATARAIAEQIGLDGSTGGGAGGPNVMTGVELAACPAGELPDAASRTAVFARVSPEQKLRLVEALQAREQIVAMTGDGVNDAPALKQADIGVAMGRDGTEVAKEAADMVLTDDNFASIEAAVEEGRGVFDNLTKFIVWTLPTNMGEGLVLLAAIGAGMALPILPVQILWINMTTAVALGMTLAFEPKEPGIMHRPPRDPGQPLLTGALGERIVLVSLLMLTGAFGVFLWEQERTGAIQEARTAAVNLFVMVELFYLFNCRSLTHTMFHVGVFSNPWAVWGAGAMVALELAFTYLPAMNRWFHTAPIDATAWLPILAVSVLVYAVVGIEKWIRRRLAARQGRGRGTHRKRRAE